MLVKGQVVGESYGKIKIALTEDQVNIIKESSYYKNICTVIDNIVADNIHGRTLVKVLPFKEDANGNVIIYAKPDKLMKIEVPSYRGLISNLFNITCSLTIYLKAYDFVSKENNERIVGVGLYLLGITK